MELTMPMLDMTSEEMTIIRWLKKAGDQVRKGDPIVEVMTEKVNIEVEAPYDGVVTALLESEGTVVKVGKPIAVIAAPGEEPAAAAAQPVPEKPAMVGPGQNRIVRASPAVRRAARIKGVELAEVEGTGLGGRITVADVERHAARQGPAAPAPSAPAPAAPAQPAPALPAAEAARPAPQAEVGGGLQGEPLSPVRRTIAKRMSASWQAPHVGLRIDVDLSRAAEMRRRLADRGSAVGWNALISYAAVRTLSRHVRINATFQDDRLAIHPAVHLGTAVDLGDGLLVPVVRDAQALGLVDMARSLADVTERARQNRVSPAELTSGTFTISNLGGFGISEFNALINPPQVAILAVGAIGDRVVAVEGQVQIRPMVTFCLSIDHRVLDGADGARFLKGLKELLEEPYLLCM